MMVNIRQTIHEGIMFKQQIFSVIDIIRSVEEVNREINEKEARELVKGHIYNSKNEYFATEGVEFWDTLTDVFGFKEILKHYMTKPEYKTGYSKTYKLYMEELTKFQKLRMETFNKFAFVNNEGEIYIRISFLNMLVMDGKSTSFIKALIDKYNAKNKVKIVLKKYKFPMDTNFSIIYRDAYVINASDVSIVTSIMKHKEKAGYLEEIAKEIKALKSELVTQKQMEEQMNKCMNGSNLTITTPKAAEEPKNDGDFETLVELMREAWNKKSVNTEAVENLEAEKAMLEDENKEMKSENSLLKMENDELKRKLKEMNDEADEMRTFIEKGMKFLNR